MNYFGIETIVQTSWALILCRLLIELLWNWNFTKTRVDVKKVVLLIELLWNWNNWFINCPASFNCLLIELLWNWNKESSARSMNGAKLLIELLWNWNRANRDGTHYQQSFNWTTLELKLAIENGKYSAEQLLIELLWNWNLAICESFDRPTTLLIELLWNWNLRTVAKRIGLDSFNWTTLELKRVNYCRSENE